MIYYHITKGQYLPSILKFGLIPGFKTGFCVMKPDQRRTAYPMAVFLTDNVKYIFDTQLTEGWVKRSRAIVLAVDCTDLHVTQRYGPETHEYLYYTTISYARIISNKAL